MILSVGESIVPTLTFRLSQPNARLMTTPLYACTDYYIPTPNTTATLKITTPSRNKSTTTPLRESTAMTLKSVHDHTPEALTTTLPAQPHHLYTHARHTHRTPAEGGKGEGKKMILDRD